MAEDSNVMEEKDTNDATESTEDVSHLSDEELDQAIDPDAEEKVDSDEDKNKEVTDKVEEETPEEDNDKEEGVASTEKEQEEKVEEKDFEKLHQEAQQMIARQAAEIGDVRALRREIADLKDKSKELRMTEAEQAELFHDDPKAAVRAAIKEEKDQDREALEQRQNEDRVNGEKILGFAKDFLKVVPDIVSLAREDGNSEEVIAHFKDHPLTVHANIALQYYRRVQNKKELDKARAEIKELKAKLKDVPNKIADTIKGKGKRLTGQPPVTEKAPKTAVTDEEMAALSDEELDKLIAA